MLSERVTAGDGPRKKIAGRFTLWTVVLASALSACGGSGSKSSAGPNPPPPRTLQGIALDPPVLTVGTGATPQFVVVGSYSDGTSGPIATGIAWSSSTPTVAELSGTGIATCTKDSTSAGTTTITASVGAYSAQATLTVTPSALLSISVEPRSADITLAANQGFSAMGRFEGDDTPRRLGNVSWSTSDGSIAEVDSDGFARGVKKGGPVAITATHTSGASAFAVLNIVDGVLQALTIAPAEGSVPVGFRRQFVAIGHFSDATSRPVPASWESSSSSIADIESSGLAFGVAVGQAVITARSGGQTKTATLVVTSPVVNPTPVAENDSGTIGADSPAAYRVSNLDPGREYLVRVSTKDDVDLTTLLFEVTDATFTTRICSSWASEDGFNGRSGGPPCRAGAADGAGNIFVRLSGPVGTEFRFDVSPLPVLDLTDGVASRDGSVDDTETYYKVVGLPVGGTFQPSLQGASPFADLFAYDRAQGPFGFGIVELLAPSIIPATNENPAFPLVGNQRVVELGPPVPGALGTTAVLGFGAPKTFVATAPASGSAYLTVEGWLTRSGTDFSVEAVPFAPPPPPPPPAP